MSNSEKPKAALPTFDETAEHEHDEHQAAAAEHEPDPNGEAPTEEYSTEEEQHYDEHGQPYAASEEGEEEQPYDEHGQPYAEQHYDEHGQPYSEEEEEPYEGDGHHDAPTQQIDAYPTTPTFTGPPAPMSRHGGPYRSPPEPEPAPAFKPLGPVAPRPFIGSALSVYGMLLWSFVVAGEFATSWITGTPMSNGSGVTIVFFATLLAWIFAVRRHRIALPATTLAYSVGRGVLALAAAGLMFFVTLILATMVGLASSRNHDFAVAFFLVVIGVAATIMGPRLTLPVRRERTHGARFALVSLWVASAIVTFIAGAELATNG